MNDMLAIGALVYLFISAGVVALLPSDIFNPTGSPTQPTADGDEEGSLSSVVNAIRFLFAAWTFTGLPALVAILISLINYISIIIGSIYTYDKIRGIGS